jgi:hypothetical protein
MKNSSEDGPIVTTLDVAVQWRSSRRGCGKLLHFNAFSAGSHREERETGFVEGSKSAAKASIAAPSGGRLPY